MDEERIRHLVDGQHSEGLFIHIFLSCCPPRCQCHAPTSVDPVIFQNQGTETRWHPQPPRSLPELVFSIYIHICPSRRPPAIGLSTAHSSHRGHPVLTRGRSNTPEKSHGVKRTIEGCAETRKGPEGRRYSSAPISCQHTRFPGFVPDFTICRNLRLRAASRGFSCRRYGE